MIIIVFTGANKDNRIPGSNEFEIYHKNNPSTTWGSAATISLISNFDYSSQEITANGFGPDALSWSLTNTENALSGALTADALTDPLL